MAQQAFTRLCHAGLQAKLAAAEAKEAAGSKRKKRERGAAANAEASAPASKKAALASPTDAKCAGCMRCI